MASTWRNHSDELRDSLPVGGPPRGYREARNVLQQITTCTGMTGCVPLAVGNVHRYRLLWIDSFGDGVMRWRTSALNHKITNGTMKRLQCSL